MSLEDIKDRIVQLTSGQMMIKGGVQETVQKNTPLIANIFFDTVEEETKTGQANITDNYVEGNYAIQDHIALSPKTYRLKGYVGEIVYKVPTNFSDSISDAISDYFSNAQRGKKTLEKLKAAYNIGNALSPTFGSYTKTAINVVNQVNDSYDRYKQIINRLRGNISQFENQRQNTVNSILFYLMDARVPIEIRGLIFERNYGKEYTSQYFIQSVQAHQGENNFISDFEIVLKELRTVESKTTTIDKKALKEANAIQTTDIANNGKAATNKIPTNLTQKQKDQIKQLKAKSKDLSASHPVKDFGATLKTWLNDLSPASKGPGKVYGGGISF